MLLAHFKTIGSCMNFREQGLTSFVVLTFKLSRTAVVGTVIIWNRSGDRNLCGKLGHENDCCDTEQQGLELHVCSRDITGSKGRREISRLKEWLWPDARLYTQEMMLCDSRGFL